MRFKRVVILIIAAAITLFLLQPLSLAESTKTPFTYELEDGKAILTRMDDAVMEELTELIIPETVDGHEVIGLGSWLIYSGRIQKITLPAALKTFAYDAIVNDNYLVNIQAAEDSAYFRSIDGVLFQKNADGSLALHSYPGGKTEVSYTVPEGVTAILPSAFDQNRNLISVQLSDDVTGIGAEAFSFSGISEILLPEGLVEIGDFAFMYCSNLRQLKLPASLTAIGKGVFRGMQALSAFELPGEGGHFKLWDNALMSSDGKRLIALPIASGNTSFAVPEGVETIDDGAFADNAAIQSVSLPEGLISIGDGAFSWLSSLSEEIVLPSTLKHIGASAFNAYNAASITLPEGLQSIGAEAFRESKLTGISVPDSVNQLNTFAFGHSLSLTEAKLPAGVNSLPWGLFNGCEALRKVVIPAGVTGISGNAFGGCKDLTIHVPDSLNYIESNAFENLWGDGEPDPGSITLAGAEDSPARQIADQMGLKYVVDISERYVPVKGDGTYNTDDYEYEYDLKSGEATITSVRNLAEKKKVEVPEQIDGYPVAGIGREQDGDTEWRSTVLYGNSSCRELVLPEGIRRINAYAFSWNELEKINLPESLETIGELAFAGSNVKALHLPKLLTHIGNGAFEGMTKLSKLTVDEGNASYEAKDNLLYDRRGSILITCPAGKSGTVKVQDGTTAIGPSAFSGCEKITQVSLPETVTELGEEAFAWCYKLAKINLPAGITSLPDRAFHMNGSLTGIKLHEGITSLGKQAFYLTQKLKSLVLPASLQEIGDSAFSRNGLAAFELAPGNEHFTVLDGVLFSKDMTTLVEYPAAGKAKEYTVPQGVTTLSEGVFSECRNLKKITLPEGITAIPEGSFSGNGKTKTEVILPKSLVHIGYAAFNHAVLGDTLEIPAGVKTIGRMAYDGASFKALVLPEGLTEIGEYSFRWNKQLTTVTLPGTLKTIPAGAFEGNAKLSEIIGAEHLVSVDETAFYGCPKLKTQLPGR